LKSATNDNSTSSLSKSLTEDAQNSPLKHAREYTQSDTEDHPHPTKYQKSANTTRSKGKRKGMENIAAKENDGVEVKQEFIEGSSTSPLSKVE
jgi:hypothetical protein